MIPGSAVTPDATRQSLVLVGSQVVAIFGIFPFGLLYVCPILAALALTRANRLLRVCVLVLSSVLLVGELVTGLADG
jgi:hypothetical protein